jgi:hypothetical protein
LGVVEIARLVLLAKTRINKLFCSSLWTANQRKANAAIKKQLQVFWRNNQSKDEWRNFCQTRRRETFLKFKYKLP